MSKSYNKVIIIGYVGAAPEVHYYDTISCRAKISVCTQLFKKKSKEKDSSDSSDVEWHRILAYGDLAKFIENRVQKGQLLLVEGQLQYELVQLSGKDSFKSAYILAKQVEVLSESKEERARQKEETTTKNEKEEEEDEQQLWKKLLDEIEEEDVNEFPFA